MQSKKQIQKPKKLRQIGDYMINEADLLGRGTYGKVYAAYKVGSDVKLACKAIYKRLLGKTEVYNADTLAESQSQLEREVQFHFRLKSENIVKVQGYEQDKEAYYMFMEYCDSDVAKLLQQKKKLPEKKALKLIRQLCKGYMEIYRRNASHRDLKPENLLLSKGTLKISDFGFVKKITNMADFASRSQLNLVENKELLRTSTLCGTREYIPPNAIEAQNNSEVKYNPEKFDMWSIGIILYFMLYGERPFSGENQKALYEAIQTKQPVFPEAPQVSAQTKSLIRRLLKKEEHERCDFKQLLGLLNMPVPEMKQSDSQINPFEPSNLEQKLEYYLKYIEYLGKIMNMLYSLNTKFTFFRKHFKIPIAYQLMTRIQELRMALLNCIEYRIKGMSLRTSKDETDFKNLKDATEEYQRVFHQAISNLGVNVEYGFGALDTILKTFVNTLASIPPADYEYIDFDLRRCILLLLRLNKLLLMKIGMDKLNEVLTLANTKGNQLNEFIQEDLKT